MKACTQSYSKVTVWALAYFTVDKLHFAWINCREGWWWTHDKCNTQ